MEYSKISFPALGLELDPIRSFSIGPLEIHLYGVIIAFGLLLAVWYACRRAPQFGFQEDHILDGVLWIVPVAIICARAYYCIFEWHTFQDDPISVLYIWKGGIAIYGGVLGAVAGVAVYCKIRKLSLPALLDLVALGFLIGQAIGRWGNFVNREAFGSETTSFLRMGLYNTFTGKWEYHHPTFLYESVWNTLGFVLLHTLSKNRKYDGQIALGYAAWYGLGRMFIEGLRTDSLYWGRFRVSQVLAMVSFVAASAVLIWQYLRPHSPEKLYVNRIKAQNTPEEPAEIQEESDHE